MTQHPEWLRDKIAQALCDHRLPERDGPDTCAVCTEDADAVLDTLFAIGHEAWVAQNPVTENRVLYPYEIGRNPFTEKGDVLRILWLSLDELAAPTNTQTRRSDHEGHVPHPR